MSERPVLLVFDPEPFHILRLQDLIRDQYRCVYVESCEELFTAYERLNETLDLVFLHSSDDGIPFLDLVKKLRGMRSTTEIFVAVRPEDMQETLELMQAGICGYIPKPFVESLLIHALEEALSGVFLRRKFLEVVQKEMASILSHSDWKSQVLDAVNAHRVSGKVFYLEDAIALFSAEVVSYQKPSLLMVEDESDFRKVLAQFLMPLYQFHHVGSVAAAADYLKKHPAPDMVMLDIYLPGKDKAETLRAMKSACPSADIAVVVDYYELDVVIDASENGARYYLVKPFFRDDMLITLANMMQRRYFREILDRIPLPPSPS
ncbi:MAG: response regulator [Candidatus Margulisbacteria bacterium]|nr:response regulator [Candidatus Margulisiibacteriota bacterium]